MTGRITRAILLVAGLLVLGLGIPLAVSVQHFYQDRAVVILQRRAAAATAEISLPFDTHQLGKAARERDVGGRFSVYDTDGERVYGTGPLHGDRPVRLALDGDPATDRGSRVLVVATPISKRVGEGVVGVMRVAEPVSVFTKETHRAWLLMLVVVAIAFAAAVAVARALAGRLAAPVDQLAEGARRLGRGEFTTGVEPSGIEELDVVGHALDQSATRLAELLARERAFSADVSHQLRTPLAGLRLRLEHADGDPSSVRGALTEVDRLEATVEHLLALARDAHPVSGDLDVGVALDEAEERWRGPYAAAGRPLRTERGQGLPTVAGSAVSIAQVLDVLLDNALRHGAGRVDLRARAAAGGLVLEVADEGPGVPDDRLAAIFERRAGDGHGIGLGIARTITEAEGGRLLVASGRPPRFHVVLPARAR